MLLDFQQVQFSVNYRGPHSANWRAPGFHKQSGGPCAGDLSFACARGGTDDQRIFVVLRWSHFWSGRGWEFECRGMKI